jgi:hypothetical protein
MTEEEKKKILELYKIHERISPEFSCTLCKQRLKIKTCNGCPVYWTIFNAD